MMRTFSILALAIMLAACSEKEPDAAGICKARIPGYDARDLNQCISACISCEHGVTTTCATSCKLKGAR